MHKAFDVSRFSVDLSSYVSAFLKKTRKNELAKKLVNGALGSVGIRFLELGFNLAVAIVLARVLGARGYGVYAYAFAIASLLAVPASFGLPNLLVRETAKAQAQHQWGLMRGLWRWANGVAVALSVLLLVAGIVLTFVLRGRYSHEQFLTFIWALGFIPLLALGSLRAASLRGLLKVLQGQLPERIIRPGLLVFFVVILAWGANGHISPEYAMALHVLAAAIAFGVGAWFLFRARPQALKDKPLPQYNVRPWFVAVLPFALIGAIQTLYTQVDTVMLGVFTTAQQVGIYQVAVKGGNLSFVWLSALGSVTAPYLARFHYANDNKRFRRLAVTIARLAAITSVPVALLFLVFGRQIISLVFGIDYIGAYLALCVLVCARCVGAWFGPIELVLSMAGHERDTALAIFLTVILNIILNWFLIEQYGISGAATATAVALLVRRLLVWHMVRRRLNFNCFALARTQVHK